MSVSGDVTVIGAYHDDDGGSNSGSAYVFHWDGSSWLEQAKLTASDAAADDYFGSSVSVSGDVAVIGAYQDDDGGTNSGSAYAFAPTSRDCNANGILDECDIADETSDDCNGNGVPDECDTITFGDFDADGDVDLDDYTALTACLSGPGVTPVVSPSQCIDPYLEAFDYDGDGDCDVDDFAIFAATFTGSLP